MTISISCRGMVRSGARSRPGRAARDIGRGVYTPRSDRLPGFARSAAPGLRVRHGLERTSLSAVPARIAVDMGTPGRTSWHHGDGLSGGVDLRGCRRPAAGLCLRARKNGHLYMNYWKGSEWNWVDQGQPPGTTMDGAPGAITYQEGTNPQRIYVFVRGRTSISTSTTGTARTGIGSTRAARCPARPASSPTAKGCSRSECRCWSVHSQHLHLNHWDGSQWHWSDLGKPPFDFTGHYDFLPGVVTSVRKSRGESTSSCRIPLGTHRSRGNNKLCRVGETAGQRLERFAVDVGKSRKSVQHRSRVAALIHCDGCARCLRPRLCSPCLHVQLRSFLEVDLCGMTRSALGAACEQLVALHYFGADKATSEVAVNGAGRVDGTAAAVDCPRAPRPRRQ